MRVLSFPFREGLSPLGHSLSSPITGICFFIEGFLPLEQHCSNTDVLSGLFAPAYPAPDKDSDVDRLAWLFGTLPID